MTPSARTLGGVFALRAAEHAGRTAVVAGRRVLTYAQLDAAAAAFAAAIAEMGIGHGDHVAVVLPNTPEAVIACLGAARIGAVVVPLDPGLPYHELRHHLRDAEAALAVTLERYEDEDVLQLVEDMLGELPDLQYVVTVGEEELWYDDRIFQFEDVLSKGEGRAVPGGRPVAEEDLLALLYTSGTTGKPRAAALSHRALLESAMGVGEAIGMRGDDRVLAALPAFAAFGFSVVVGTLAVGATLVLQERFAAARTLRLLADEEITVLHGVPTMFELLMREQGFDPSRLARLRTGVIAGAPVSPELRARVGRWCDAHVAYGLAETGPALSVTRNGDAPGKRATTVGRPLPGVEVRILDGERGAPCAPGVAGEIAVRGTTLMRGYERMPGETARSFSPEGFFLTGDLGVLDEEGYLSVVGRRTETILRGGFRIFPREVEDPLRAHPAVDDVRVVGVPEPVLGELLVACVVPVEGALVTASEIRDFARDVLAAHKIPDRVRFLDALPVTGTGEAGRRALASAIALETTPS